MVHEEAGIVNGSIGDRIVLFTWLLAALASFGQAFSLHQPFEISTTRTTRTTTKTAQTITKWRRNLGRHHRPNNNKDAFLFFHHAAGANDKDNVVVVVHEVKDPRPFSVHVRASLAHVWGRQPLLLRQAFDTKKEEWHSQQPPPPPPWPSWQDIVDLACSCYNTDNTENEDDDDDESSWSGESARFIQHTPGQLDSFTMQVGPFDARSNAKIHSILHSSLPKGDPSRPSQSMDDDNANHTGNNQTWTLVVNDVDRYISALSHWVEETFCFLPRWRRDDAQVSLAPTGGGIGPHVDNYDVFLIQTSGQRLWRIGSHKLSVAQELDWLVPDLSVRILDWRRNPSSPTTKTTTENLRNNSNDKHDHHQKVTFGFTEWQLQEGDVLYLPPRVVHWGTSLSHDCMTLSIGCRAPSALDLLGPVLEELSTTTTATATTTARYQDPHRIQQWIQEQEHNDNGPSLTQQDKDQAKQLVWNAVQALLEQDEETWDAIVGKRVTEPNRLADFLWPLPYEERMQRDQEYRMRWGRRASVALRRVVQEGRGCLYRVHGISFATSSVPRTRTTATTSSTTQHTTSTRNTNNGHNHTLAADTAHEEERYHHQPRRYEILHRLFGRGQMWQVVEEVEVVTARSERSSYHNNTTRAMQVFQRIEQGKPIRSMDLKQEASPDLMRVLEDLVEQGFLYPDVESQEV
ncbi:hypothetical protein ACA910_016157 [Epithemia clementina (nom. ined.)]